MNATAECPRSLVVERMFPHPQEKLWRALTNGSLLEQWMMPNNFAPVVGHKFQFHTDPKPNWDGVVDGEVLTVEPIDRLSYTWGTGGPQSGMLWVVEWILKPSEGGTHVRMEQSGFRPEQKGNYQGAKYGWNLFFDGLGRIVAEGDPQ